MYSPNQMSPFNFVLGRRTGVAAIDNIAIVPPFPVEISKDSDGNVIQMTLATAEATEVSALSRALLERTRTDADMCCFCAAAWKTTAAVDTK